MARTAEDFHRRAVELSNNGRYAPAQRALDAAERTADADLRARIVGTRAFVLQRTGAPDEAERLCREALAGPGLSDHTIAILNGQLGALAMYGGRLEEAHKWLSRAISRLSDDPVSAARVRINRSLASSQRGRLDDAAADLEVAIETFDAAGHPVEAAHARHNLGYFALLAGDIVAALQDMQAARPVTAATPVGAAIGDVDRAEVLRDAGLSTEAERILERTASLFGTLRMPQSRAEAEFNLARSLLTHDAQRAVRPAGAAERRFRALGNDTWAARARAVRLRALLAGGSLDRGGERVPEPRRKLRRDDIDDTAAILDHRGFRGEAAALRMAHELWRARHAAAMDGSSRAIRIPADASMDVRLMAHEVRAARAATIGRDGESRRHAARGLDVLAEWQRTYGSLDLQTSISMHGASLIWTGLDAAVRSRRPEVVFEWSERARHLSQQVVPLRPPPDPEFAAELAELRMLRADDPSGAWLSDPRAATLYDRARERQWSATGSVEFQKRIDLPELRSALDSDTALLAFVYSGVGMHALVVTSERASLVDVDRWGDVQRALPGLRADLDMAASIRTGPMAEVIARSLRERLESLSAALLDGPLGLTSARRIVITVPGVLNSIPWGVLPALQGRVFTLAVSATRWARLHRSPAVEHGSIGFAVGPRVARGLEEVRAAASAWPSSSLLHGEDATVDAVTELAAGLDLLHVAAHGRHALDNPLFSGLSLADGTLFGYDIDRMPRVPSTVVLSACEVGRSAVRWGEEAIGMTRTWLHAGTRAVVATPVIVADDVACELLGAMHAGLAEGLPPAEALAAASARTGIVAPFQTHGAGF
ncbi:CHAT domain-containing protein [Microbacterium sp. P02]|uniref:CHAT domain-containing protein n=1 Tax=Microbacterium sp. P02 TaxID=3366260 RepID=UPI00366BAAFA